MINTKDQNKFSLKARLKSFKHAFNGWRILVSEEHNARIHLTAAVAASILGFYFQISTLEWLALVLCIGLVFAFELINSAIENLADYASPNIHPLIKKTKDMAAGAVLAASLAAFIVGLIIFIPKICTIWS